MKAPQHQRVPKFRIHKATLQAYVELSGKRIYLGFHESPEAKRKYHALVAEWLANGRQLSVPKNEITIKEMIARYWLHAERYYRDSSGIISRELRNIADALRPVKELYGTTPAIEFGPRALKAVRQKMIEANLCRRNINSRLGRIRRVFRWAASEELISGELVHALLSVDGLRQGRGEAKESEPVRPVAQDNIVAIRPFVSRQVWTMVQLQLLTGARSGELSIMRPIDIDMSGRIWVYIPSTHKTAHHGHERRIYIGPQGQAELRPFLDRRVDAFCFSPAEAEEERRATAHAARKTPLSCGNTPGSNRRESPRRKASDRYSTKAYCHAIRQGCDRAFPPPATLARRRGESQQQWRLRLKGEGRLEELFEWRNSRRWHPHRLRHSAATNLRKEFGLETARIILGHRSAAITTIYAEADQQKAIDAMLMVG